jgi:hypothetical protein
VTIFKNQYFLNKKSYHLAVLREEARDSLYQLTKFKKYKVKVKIKAVDVFVVFLIFSIKIPFQRAQALGSTAKIN